jgi:hypothetical protein
VRFLFSDFSFQLFALPLENSEKQKAKTLYFLISGFLVCFLISAFSFLLFPSASQQPSAEGGEGFARFAVRGKELENPLVFPRRVAELPHANVGIG